MLSPAVSESDATVTVSVASCACQQREGKNAGHRRPDFFSPERFNFHGAKLLEFAAECKSFTRIGN